MTSAGRKPRAIIQIPSTVACTYEGRLLPRWLTGWGKVGAVAMALGAILAVLAVLAVFAVFAVFADKPVTSHVPLAAPIGVQEMVFAVWLLIRGFKDAPFATRQVDDRGGSEA